MEISHRVSPRRETRKRLRRAALALAAIPAAAQSRPQSRGHAADLEAAGLIRAGKLADAERRLDAVLAAAPNDAVALEPQDAQARLFLGYILLKLEKLDETRTTLEPAVAADTSAPEGSYYLALVAQEQHDYAHAHVALGISYLRLKDLARTRAELELAGKQAPGDQQAHFNLAMVYARTSEPELARAQMAVVEKLKSERDARALEDELAALSAPR